MKKQFLLLCLSAFLVQALLYAQTPDKSIIPQPVKMELKEGSFNIDNQTQISVDNSQEMFKLGVFLANAIKTFSNLNIAIVPKSLVKSSQNTIQIITDLTVQQNEGYKISITPNEIKIIAKNGVGIFYAIQTLTQLLPTEHSNGFTISCLEIEDYPRFQWRGMHLDVCRHFFPVEFVKKYIDILAMYKMNTFHWHLTEDQGWRIEIKKYPKLTEVGAWRKETAGDGKKHGGFYTQEQIKEVVAYAKERYINVLPEIEMPGHAKAALASYPEYSCTGGPFDVETTFGVFDDIYCAGNEKTFKFLEDILDEVIPLFPYEYIHIGGDEAPKTRWEKCDKCQQRIKAEGLKDEHELQSYFIQRIEKYINSKGKKIIGWDEILEGGLAPNASVMSWRGVEGGIAAAKMKHNAVMSPTDFCYFDYYQAKSGEPKAIGGFLNLEKVYSYEPVPDSLSEEEAKYIIGVQANMWTEYIETPGHVEYMLLPRLCALSETAWSPKGSKNFEDFSKRILHNCEILSSKKINYRKPTTN
jgi:hexosaminidase